MARLAGHFAGVVQIHLPENQAEGFMTALPTLADRGLTVNVVDSDGTLMDVDHHHSLQTVIENAPMSGERIFRAEAKLAPPSQTSFEHIRMVLE